MSVTTVRSSLMPGFDSAAATAIREAPLIDGVFVAANLDDSMTVDVRLSTDSARGSTRVFAASFPRMPVLDAVALRTNRAPEFPDDAKNAGATSGEVVMRFVVDRTGSPALETLEVIRATAFTFVRAAVRALPSQLFTPATVHGCAVAQLVDYPFTFVLPEPVTPPARH